MRRFALLLTVFAVGTGLFAGSAHAADGQTEQPPKHKVAEGETLTSIATNNQLDSWRPLWNANQQLENPDLLNVDQELVMPTPATPERPLPVGYGAIQSAAPAAPQAMSYQPAPAPRFNAQRSASQPVVSLANGDLFARIRARESGGNYAINTGNGYYGAYQYDMRTWNNYGGYARADLAPAAVQDAKAHETYAQRGCSPWPNTCR